MYYLIGINKFHMEMSLVFVTHDEGLGSWHYVLELLHTQVNEIIRPSNPLL